MSEPRKQVRVRIEGRVQGVGFRAWLQREAAGLGLEGFVRNRRDGGVEAVLAGPLAQVDRMVERCRTGPRSAAVQFVKVLDEPGPVDHGPFTVRETV